MKYIINIMVGCFMATLFFTGVFIGTKNQKPEPVNRELVENYFKLGVGCGQAVVLRHQILEQPLPSAEVMMCEATLMAKEVSGTNEQYLTLERP